MRIRFAPGWEALGRRPWTEHAYYTARRLAEALAREVR